MRQRALRSGNSVILAVVKGHFFGSELSEARWVREYLPLFGYYREEEREVEDDQEADI